MSVGLQERVGGWFHRDNKAPEINPQFVPISKISEAEQVHTRAFIGHMWDIASFSSGQITSFPEGEIRFPLKASDLVDQAPQTRRLFPSTLPTYFEVTLQGGRLPGVGGKSPFTAEQALVRIAIPEEAQSAKPLRGSVTIDASRFILSDGFAERVARNRLVFKSHLMGPERDLLADGVDPKPVVTELATIVRNLRDEFANREADYRINHLSPRQQELVVAVEGRWAELYERRSVALYAPVDFLLGGTFDFEAKLEGLFIELTGKYPGTSGVSLMDSVRDILFDDIEFTEVHGRRKLPRKVTTSFATMNNGGRDLQQRGTIILGTPGGARVLDTIPIELYEEYELPLIQGVARNVTSCIFTKFLEDRVGLYSGAYKDHVLSTSFPLNSPV